jgi:hypothetical protein
MFLSQKTRFTSTSPNTSTPTNPNGCYQVLLTPNSGWEDDEEDKKDKYEFTTQKGESKATIPDLFQGDGFSDLTHEPPKKENNQKFYLDWDELNEKEDMYSV